MYPFNFLSELRGKEWRKGKTKHPINVQKVCERYAFNMSLTTTRPKVEYQIFEAFLLNFLIIHPGLVVVFHALNILILNII